MSQTEVRTIEGIEIPEPGDWQLDPVHTAVEFSARHLMVSKVRGKFTGVSGNIHISDDPLAGMEVTADGFRELAGRSAALAPRAAAVLEGGYNLDTLPDLVAAALDGFSA